nr:hypothetical protein [Alteraurantiacibacter buctensis]
MDTSKAIIFPDHTAFDSKVVKEPEMDHFVHRDAKALSVDAAPVHANVIDDKSRLAVLQEASHFVFDYETFMASRMHGSDIST